MFFFKKKSRSFSLNALLGFDFRKIDFESVFPFESYATTSLAVATSQVKTSKLMLLNDCQGTDDPVFNNLLKLKQVELQSAIQEQSSSVVIEAAFTRDSRSDDDFIYLNTNTPMSDVLDSVFQSHVRQKRPILVDIERSSLIQNKQSRLGALLVRDASFHINFLSLLGHHGEFAKRTAYRVLYSGRVAYLGFQMDDFSILAEEKQIVLADPVISLLADQSTQRKLHSKFVDEMPVI